MKSRKKSGDWKRLFGLFLIYLSVYLFVITLLLRTLTFSYIKFSFESTLFLIIIYILFVLGIITYLGEKRLKKIFRG